MSPTEITLYLASYLLGSVPFGLLIGKLRGVDIRTRGSGNIGATNVFRCVGKAWGIGAFCLDFFKGYAAATLLPLLIGPFGQEILSPNGELEVSGVRLKNPETGQTWEKECQGVFMAIGHVPNTQMFKDVLDMDENGYLITAPDSTATNIPGIFACGGSRSVRFNFWQSPDF